MSRKIILEWNFLGPDAEGTAKHHLIHLQQFLKREKITAEREEMKKIDDNLSSTMILVSEEVALKLRDVLKPHKAYVVNEKA